MNVKMEDRLLILPLLALLLQTSESHVSKAKAQHLSESKLALHFSSVHCSTISPLYIAQICEQATHFGYELYRKLEVPIIGCKKGEVSEALISSIGQMKFFGSCKWINFFLQWSNHHYDSLLKNGEELFRHPADDDILRLQQRWTHREFDFEDPQPAINLSRVHLKLAGISVAPILTFKQTFPDIEGGTFYDFFDTISTFYNFTYEINAQRFKEQGPGRKSANGSWTGVIGGIIRKEFDASFMGHQVFRYPYMHYTTPLFYDESVFITKPPGILTRWQALTEPFTPFVWSFIMVAVIAVTITCYLIITMKIRMGEERSHQKFDLLWNCWRIVFGSCVEQGSSAPTPVKPLVVLWCFIGTVIIAGYKDKLIAGLTFPELEFVPTKFSHLRENPDYRIFLDGFLISFRLNNSHSPNVVAMKKRFEPQRKTVDCVMATLLHEKTVCVGYKPMLSMAIASNLTTNYDFNPIILSQNVLQQVPVSVVLQKYSQIAPDFERITGAYMEAHLYENSKASVLMTFKRRGKSWLEQGKSELRSILEGLMNIQGNAVTPLKIKQLLVIFAFYLVSCLFSVVIFTSELGLHGVHGSSTHVQV